MKLLFIFTGGTIGSTLTGDVISADETKSYQILAAYEKKYGISFEYDVVEPYTELSENNTGRHIAILAESVGAALKKSYDGIVVTHGTDTLQYSAAAVGYTVGLNTIPICFVAANEPIESPDSNALDNLRGAIELIGQRGGRGAFVVYRNSESDTVMVHRATRLLESRAYSDEAVSLKNIPYGMLDKEFRFVKNPDYRESEDETEPLAPTELGEENEGTMVISARPGIRYPELPRGVRYVLVNTYHSGTLDTKSPRAREFFREAQEKGVKVFATGVYGGPRYASAKHFEELGICPVMNLSPIAAYVKLWLADSMGVDPAEILGRSLSGDVI